MNHGADAHGLDRIGRGGEEVSGRSRSGMERGRNTLRAREAMEGAKQ